MCNAPSSLAGQWWSGARIWVFIVCPWLLLVSESTSIPLGCLESRTSQSLITYRSHLQGQERERNCQGWELVWFISCYFASLNIRAWDKGLGHRWPGTLVTKELDCESGSEGDYSWRWCSGSLLPLCITLKSHTCLACVLGLLTSPLNAAKEESVITLWWAWTKLLTTNPVLLSPSIKEALRIKTDFVSWAAERCVWPVKWKIPALRPEPSNPTARAVFLLYLLEGNQKNPTSKKYHNSKNSAGDEGCSPEASFNTSFPFRPSWSGSSILMFISPICWAPSMST